MLEGGMKFRGVRRVPLFQSCDGFCRPMNAGRVNGSGRDWMRDDELCGNECEGKGSTDAERYYF